MTPGVILSPPSDDDKQIGCVAGFLQIFDRHQRFYAPKRIPTTPATGLMNSSSSDERSEMFPSSLENLTQSPEIPVNVLDLKERLKSSWKLREGPRLSLDSRLRPRENAGSDKNRRSPSVVARLMGLDNLPDGGKTIKKAELRRSASESRAYPDLRRFVENDVEIRKFRSTACFVSESKQSTPVPPPKRLQSPSLQRRSYFNSQEFFPEPNRKKGIDEAAKDLDSLKQILEAWQLKGLLHSKSQISSNLVSNRPIVVMIPGPKTIRRSEPFRRRPVVEEKPVRCRSPRSPNPIPTIKPLINNVNSSSPKSSPRKMTPDLVTARSPRSRRIRERVRSPAEDDTTTTLSASSVTSSQLDLERSRAGQNSLERCDKLLNSITAFTSTEQVTTSDQQPSPVSVLDSSFLGVDNSPSPVKKRSIIFDDPFVEWEKEDCCVGSRPDRGPKSDSSDYAYVSNVVLAYDRFPNSSFDIYSFLEQHHNATGTSRESGLHRQVLFDMAFEILDRRRHVSPWESFSRWRPLNCGEQLIREVWEEVKRAREVAGEAEDPNEVTRKAIQKDVTFEEHAWSGASSEISDAVLYLERLVFKDLVGEMIQDLVDVASKTTGTPLIKRKLLFITRGGKIK